MKTKVFVISIVAIFSIIFLVSISSDSEKSIDDFTSQPKIEVVPESTIIPEPKGSFEQKQPEAISEPIRVIIPEPEIKSPESEAKSYLPPESESVLSEEPKPEQNCHPSYSGCLNPNASDYDCEGGSGDGPYYTGKVKVIGPDVFGLDRDKDGWGCE